MYLVFLAIIPVTSYPLKNSHAHVAKRDAGALAAFLD